MRTGFYLTKFSLIFVQISDMINYAYRTRGRKAWQYFFEDMDYHAYITCLE